MKGGCSRLVRIYRTSRASFKTQKNQHFFKQVARKTIMETISFDIFAAIARQAETTAFHNLSRTCRRFRDWRNHPHVLQQFNDVHIDRHLENGHLTLLKYKHEKGYKCSYMSSVRAVTIALEKNYFNMLEYLFSLGKRVEGSFVIQLAATKTQPRLMKLIYDNVFDPRALLRAAVNQNNGSLAALFPPKDLVSVLSQTSYHVRADDVIQNCVASHHDWDFYFLQMRSHQGEGVSAGAFTNPKNKRYLTKALLKKYSQYRQWGS